MRCQGDELSVNELSVDELLVDELSVDELSPHRSSHQYCSNGKLTGVQRTKVTKK
jgi:hypothetical protein